MNSVLRVLFSAGRDEGDDRWDPRAGARSAGHRVAHARGSAAERLGPACTSLQSARQLQMVSSTCVWSPVRSAIPQQFLAESGLDQECRGITMPCSEQLHCRNNGQGPRVLQRQKCCSMDELDLELRATLTKDQSDPYIQDCRSISALQLLHCSGLQGSQFHTPTAGTEDLCAVARTCRQLRTGSSC